MQPVVLVAVMQNAYLFPARLVCGERHEAEPVVLGLEKRIRAAYQVGDL